VLDGQRRVVYMGAIDDSWDDEQAVERPYLREAIEAVLEGNTPRWEETRATGCEIEYHEP
jgi:hypothetical protein